MPARKRKLSKRRFRERVKAAREHVATELKGINDDRELTRRADELFAPIVARSKTKVTNSSGGRSIVLSRLASARKKKDIAIRRAVLVDNRFDVFVKDVLKYTMLWFHELMYEYQEEHDEALFLMFRGGWKTTILTIARTLYEIVRNRDIRILIAAESSDQSQTFLRTIRQHLESNEDLIRIFGDFRDSKVKWTEKEIVVLGRTQSYKESTVTTCGLNSPVVSKHFDIIICDDLVTEDNARTPGQRERVKVFYYKSLEPTLEPDGKRWVIGTRYHHLDLYGHLIENEMADSHIIIPVLNDEDHSIWEERFPSKRMVAKRKSMGVIIFRSQMMCDTDAMIGEIFQYDWFKFYNDGDLPTDLVVYIGVDLAISMDKRADYFVCAAVGHHIKTNTFWILEYVRKRCGFKEQTKVIVDMGVRHNAAKVSIEAVAYQKVQVNQVKDDEIGKYFTVRPVYTNKDKLTRAYKQQGLFEDGRVHVRSSMTGLIEEHVLFPSAEHDDIWDAVDIAITSALRKRRRSRRTEEPGLL